MAAVIGVPHDSHGEEVVAYVVRAPGAQLSAAELVAWCRESMASYTYPRLVEFVDVLPTNATGKILKRELRDAHLARAGS
ncbi:hypothetical protein KK483_00150 [Streptomyces sp. FIT100]|nr:hypothetical protein [Streptomyces sp. FIT100]UUN25011.1 hypothetical protein KK483_00150 [Streptomyces sp. FIT100]